MLTPVTHSLADEGDPAVRSEEQQRLATALATLRPDDRLVLALRWFEQLSEREMAEALDIRPGTVKSRLSRAMERLKAALAADEGGVVHA